MSLEEPDYDQEEAERAARRERLKPLRDQLRLDFNADEDELLLRKLGAAEAWISRYLGRDVAFILEPADIQEAILQLAGHWYENREATLAGDNAAPIPFGVVSLLAPHAQWAM